MLLLEKGLRHVLVVRQLTRELLFYGAQGRGGLYQGLVS